MGKWEGLFWKEVEEKYPNEYKEWHLNRRYTKTPNGESYEDTLDMVLKSLNNMITENNDDIVIVSHSAIIMCLQCYVTNTSFNEILKFKTKNADITEIDSNLLFK